MSLLRPTTNGPSVQEFMNKLICLTEESPKSMARGMELYSMIYSLATRVPVPATTELFEAIGKLFENLARNCKTNLDNLRPSTPEESLNGHSRFWLLYKRTMNQIACVCLYLDRLTETKALQSCTVKVLNRNVPLMPVSELACFIWFQVFLESGSLGNSFVKRFEEIRSNESVSVGGLTEFVDAYICAEPALVRIIGKGCYTANVEDPFISSTSDYYKKLVSSSLRKMSFGEYIKFADNTLSFEFDIANKVLLPFGQHGINTSDRLREILCEIVIISNIEKFYSKFSTIIRAGEHIELFIKLLSLAESSCEESDLMSKAAKIFEEELRFATENIINDQQQSGKPDLKRLADLFQSSMDYLVTMANFVGERNDFAKVIERTKTKFLSSRSGKSTVLQAFVKFVDAALSGCISLDSDIAKFTEFFVPHFADIDELGSLYASDLASRLLHSSEVSFDQELKCISAFPPEIAIRLKRMIGDIQNSRSKPGGNNFSCDVLTNLTWPVPSELEAFSNRDLPKAMQTFASGFEKSYTKQHPKQKLTWIHQLSRVTLNYTAPNLRNYELSCTFPQAMLLLELESNKGLFFGNLVDLLKISRRDVYRHLKPMCSIGLISYSQKVKSYSDVHDNMKVKLNLDYENQKSRIRFGPVSIDGTSDDASVLASPVSEPMEISETTSLTDQDKYVLQCMVVKIAKANRTISAAHLHQLIIQAWKRPAQLSHPQISDCLKILQDKDFLEFDEVQSVFRYIP